MIDDTENLIYTDFEKVWAVARQMEYPNVRQDIWALLYRLAVEFQAFQIRWVLYNNLPRSK